MNAPPRLYPRRGERQLDPALFANPAAEYRGTPFWSWNNRLDANQLCRQIDCMKAMGFGGFHMHPRTGLATEYLGREFMACVRACVEKARQEQMLAWLYDEDRFASGFAGGLATRDLRSRQKYLRITRRPMTDHEVPANLAARSPGIDRCDRSLVARYRVALDAQGCLASSHRLAPAAPDEPQLVYAYLEHMPATAWHNGQSYLDTLDPAAVRKFIEITHETYWKEVGSNFGTVIPAIFTDEPNFKWSDFPAHPHSSADCILPWTNDLADTYRQAWGEDLLDLIPELLWDLPAGRRSRARWRYRDHVSERFAVAYCDQVSAWCQQHGIALTGHLNAEDNLLYISMMAGDVMRQYRAFHLPGIDLLFDRFDLTTVKQVVSVARQDGREGALSEIYGVTNWDFPFQGHKRQGDWQAALGITIRCHHLYHVSLEGHAKRDYPASIGHQSPWHAEYRLIEDHFARVNTALVRGRAVVRIAVVHPLESRWLTLGPVSSNALVAADQEQAFQDVCRWLLDACLDFDYIAESLLPRQCPDSPGGVPTAGGAGFPVGAMRYDAVVVSDLLTIRSTTLARLEAFATAGGRVIFLGRVPQLVDAEPSDAPAALSRRCPMLPLQREPLIRALADLAEVQLVHPGGALIDDVLHQVREDGPRRWVFMCCHRRTPVRDQITVRIRGRWRATQYDTLSGATAGIPHRHAGNWTELAWERTSGGHLLLALDPSDETRSDVFPPLARWTEIARLSDPVGVTLHEPNVLLLDQAEYRLDEGPWRAADEIHRAENHLRRERGWFPKNGGVAQPWSVRPSGQRRAISWRFAVESAVKVPAPRLALEHPEHARLRLNGRPIEIRDGGWWIDESLRTTPLPDLEPGRHLLEVDQPFTPEGTLEYLYLLGDFGVQVAGRHACLIAPLRQLAWGDWTGQGLPFYGGSVTYHAEFTADAAPVSLHVPWFANPLVAVELDGKRIGPIAFYPYRLDLGAPASGTHRLDLVCYGNRVNTLGALHAADRVTRTDWGPGAWETTGDTWSDEYQLWPQGITSAPRLERQS